MSDLPGKNEYGFKVNEEEWITVHSTAVTNTNPGSMVTVKINTERICEDMSNKEFREIINSILRRAVPLVEASVRALKLWTPNERARVQRWFGRNDETARTILLNGIARVSAVLRGLSPANFVRTGSDRDRATGCMPNPARSGQEAAHVCAPDTATHTISISPLFCTMRHWSDNADSRVSTVIHEVTHFLDTMASKDHQYTIAFTLRDWAQSNSDLALNNADSVAGYIVEGD
ncbi:M35 family metallo-endopeptidase [Paraburkholderia tropica]|uniref:M35 family metallo-endopeptidase n=1 Tax=Paraburkholderia tropica TaxID=92647 RepID=UPI002AB601C8|nr:M35 family metallo-endopeptidase [Paraburkholderia tropica]